MNRIRSRIRFRFHNRLQRQFSSNPSGKQTHFGFQSVDENEKSQKVYDVFENVASRYDLMNDVMSFGIHRFWKDRFVQKLNPSANDRLLDMAGGTGDIAFRVIRHIDYKSGRSGASSSDFNIDSQRSGSGNIATDFGPATGNEVERETPSYTQQVEKTGTGSASEYTQSVERTETPSGKIEYTQQIERAGSSSIATAAERTEKSSSTPRRSVTVCDINQAMLDVGKKRALAAGISESITWVQGDAEKLPFSDNEFDAYTIAFGIRNCTHIDRVLKEAYRVLKRGGRFLCLEFSEVRAPGISSFYDWYSFQIIPVMGQIFAADWKSYQYLVESIQQFPNQDEFANMIRSSGFRFVTYENLSFGVVAIHSGFKL